MKKENRHPKPPNKMNLYNMKLLHQCIGEKYAIQ